MWRDPRECRRNTDHFYHAILHCRLSSINILLKKWTGLPRWRSGWESACQCRGHGFGPWSGRIPHAAQRLGPWATIAEPARLGPVLRNRRGRDGERPAHRDEEWPPLATTGESPRTETKTQHSHKFKKKKKKSGLSSEYISEMCNYHSCWHLQRHPFPKNKPHYKTRFILLYSLLDVLGSSVYLQTAMMGNKCPIKQGKERGREEEGRQRMKQYNRVIWCNILLWITWTN